MRFRKLAGITAGALTVAGLSVPFGGIAHAATSSVELTGSYVCTTEYGLYDLTWDYNPGLAVSADAAAVTATSSALTNMQAFKWEAEADRDTEGKTPAVTTINDANFNITSLTANVKADLNGESVALTSTRTTRAGINQEQVVADLVGTRAGADDLTSGQITEVSLAANLEVNFFRPSTVPITASCEGTSELVDTTAPEPISRVQAFDCTVAPFGSKMEYDTPSEIKVVGGNVEIQFGNIRGLVPVPLADTPLTVTLVADVNGTETTFTGSHNLNLAASAPIPMPVLRGAYSGTGLDVKIKSATIIAAHTMMDVTIGCEGLDKRLIKTTTAVTADTSVPNQAVVDVTVGGGQAGKVAFILNGAFKGAFDVVDGKVSQTLTDLPAGKHTLRVAFRATDEENVAESEQTIEITVVDPVVVVDTVTTAKGSAVAANTVKIEAAVAPAGAGKFEVREGSKLVASTAAVDGKATITLSGVAKGAHTYAVTFVPADAATHKPSTATLPAITVADKVSPKPPVVFKATSKATVKVTGKKAGKASTVRATVKVGKGNATGKVTIKVTKKGVKKAVANQTKSLKGGKASIKTKKLKKGTYTATISYKGNAKTKASSKKVTFKVK